MATDDLLFDTGILKNILRSPVSDQNLNNALDQLGFSGRAPYMIASPLMLLEALGLSGDTFHEFAEGSPNELGIREILGRATAQEMDVKFTRAFHFIEDCIRKNSKTTLSGLLAAYKTERDHPKRSDVSKYLFESLFGANLTEVRYSSFVSRYAFDIFQGLPIERYGFDKQAAAKLDSYFLSTIFFSLKDENTNFACARYVDNIWRRAHGKNAPSPLAPYEAGKEMLDTEQTHYAVAGSRHDGSAFTVTILTNENLSGWNERISRYLELIRFVNQRASSQHGSLELFPGFIYSLDPSGKLTGASIDVRREFDCRI